MSGDGWPAQLLRRLLIVADDDDDDDDSGGGGVLGEHKRTHHFPVVLGASFLSLVAKPSHFCPAIRPPFWGGKDCGSRFGFIVHVS